MIKTLKLAIAEKFFYVKKGTSTSNIILNSFFFKMKIKAKTSTLTSSIHHCTGDSRQYSK